VPGNPTANYLISFDQSGKASSVTLENPDQDCYN
jgi:hypothetical protein